MPAGLAEPSVSPEAQGSGSGRALVHPCGPSPEAASPAAHGTKDAFYPTPLFCATSLGSLLLGVLQGPCQPLGLRGGWAVARPWLPTCCLNLTSKKAAVTAPEEDSRRQNEARLGTQQSKLPA